MITGSASLSSNLAQFRFAHTGGPLGDSIDSFANAFYNASDTLKIMFAMAAQIINSVTNSLCIFMPAPLNATFALTVYSSEFSGQCGLGMACSLIGLASSGAGVPGGHDLADAEADGTTAGES